MKKMILRIFIATVIALMTVCLASCDALPFPLNGAASNQPGTSNGVLENSPFPEDTETFFQEENFETLPPEDVIDTPPVVDIPDIPDMPDIPGMPETPNTPFDPENCSHEYEYLSEMSDPCIAGYWKYGYCPKCGSETSEFTNPTGHNINANGFCTNVNCYFSLETHDMCMRTGSKKENQTEATCTIEGSYDEVCYCLDCGKEISRKNIKTSDPLGHEPEAKVTENLVAATCAAEGSYDEVCYCSVCNQEISRESKSIPTLEHTPQKSVIENSVSATCTVDGGYDTVVYCSVCKGEVSKITTTLSAPGHTPKESVKENVVETSCAKAGGYDTVVYCSVCDEEVSRVKTTIPKLSHTLKDPVEENRVIATCSSNGSFDTVVYCSVCNNETSRVTTILKKLPHTPGDVVTENEIAPSCTNLGSYDNAVYCTVCKTELSRTTQTTNKILHIWEDGKCSVCKTGEYSQGLAFNLLSNNTYAVSGLGTCTDSKIIIPDKHEGLAVTAIQDNAFKNQRHIVSITIPSSILFIYTNAFSGCCITEVINKSALNITAGEYYNHGGIALYAIEVHSGPSKLINVNDYLFYNCDGVDYLVSYVGNETKLVLPSSYNEQPYQLYKYAFFNHNKLTEITIPGVVNKIDAYSFYQCSNLAHVIIGEGITSIEEFAFAECKKLTSVTIPDTMISIGTSAFDNCINLTTASISKNSNLQTIGSDAFRFCEKLENITIPSSIKNIANRAFCGCESFTKVVVYSGTIHQYAFSSCTGLTEVIIGNDVTEVGFGAFSNCTSLNTISIPSTFSFLGFFFGAYDYSENAEFVPLSLKTVILTGGDSVYAQAFYGCKNIDTVIIPDSVTTIGKEAFKGCSGLVSVTLGKLVKTIESDAFANCVRLAEVINKTKLSIVAGSTTYGGVAEHAIEVHNGESKVDRWNGYLFYSYLSTHYLLAYTGYNTEIVLPQAYGGYSYKIHDYAFYLCEYLQKVTFEQNSRVTSIGKYAFYNCYYLTSINLPGSVSSIGSFAFYNCSHLTSIVIPNGVLTIGNCAFASCASLTSVSIPKSVTIIGFQAFYNSFRIQTIFYDGNYSEWAAVQKGNEWNCEWKNGSSCVIGYTMRYNPY